MNKRKQILNATRNRRELITGRLTRRDFLKMGLLTTAGFLVPKNGLSAAVSGGQLVSPPTAPFRDPMPLPPVKEHAALLDPAPNGNPLPGEGRKFVHQRFDELQAQVLYEMVQREGVHRFHSELPVQTIWGFDGLFPGPTYVMDYGVPAILRNRNNLPEDNRGFGLPSVTTHIHNGHQASESDGNPCNFFERGQFYDHLCPNALAGFSSQFPPAGDIREALSTLFYHDHRVDFTAQNVYKGLVGFYLLFNEFDTGNEATGFRLPAGEFDVPMLFADKVFDEDGILFFDLFNLDGILGDKFTVNGVVQPFFQVHPRKYRFRWLNAGPSRFLKLFLTDPENLGREIPITQISTDGNLSPAPVRVDHIHLSVADRHDVVIDFAPFAGRPLLLENRLEQTNGRGPTNRILPAGRGDAVLRFDVVLQALEDSPPLPARFYDLPPASLDSPEIATVRRFVFERQRGQWVINDRFMNCDEVLAAPREGTAEVWILENKSGGWQHPVHIHLEEFQILARNGEPAPAGFLGRRDIATLNFNTTLTLFMRFRDFLGRYPMHCHNLLHEDHSMMMLWEVVP